MFTKISDFTKRGGEVKKNFDALFFIKALHKITDKNKLIPDILSATLDDFLCAKSKPSTNKPKKKDTKRYAIIETVGNIMMTEVVERMISKIPAGQIATEEKMFEYLEETYPYLAMQGSTYISNNVVKAWIGIDTSVVK